MQYSFPAFFFLAAKVYFMKQRQKPWEKQVEERRHEIQREKESTRKITKGDTCAEQHPACGAI